MWSRMAKGAFIVVLCSSSISLDHERQVLGVDQCEIIDSFLQEEKSWLKKGKKSAEASPLRVSSSHLGL